MWTYCVSVLHFSEDVAASRIEVARLLRRLPRLADVLRTGAIHLTGLKLLASHLTEANCDELVALATGKTKAKIEELIVTRLAPKPLVADSIHKLPSRETPRPSAASAPSETRCSALAPTPVASPPSPARRPKVEPLAPDAFKVQFTADTELRDLLLEAQELLRHQNRTGDLATLFKKSLRLLVAQVRKERFGIGAKPRNSSQNKCHASATVSHSSQDKCPDSAKPIHSSQTKCSDSVIASHSAQDERTHSTATSHSAQDERPDSAIASHSAQNKRSSTESHHRSRDERPVEQTPTEHEYPNAEPSPHWAQDGYSDDFASSRHIPVDIRREVYSRDGGQCTFTAKDGRRCSARGWLEFDHVDGFALTHSHSVEGLRLRCRAHNQLAAEELYGRDFMERARRSTRPGATAPERADDAAELRAPSAPRMEHGLLF